MYPLGIIRSDAAAAYKRVERWTKKVDLFSKDVIFIPINEKYVGDLESVFSPELVVILHASLACILLTRLCAVI